MELNKLSNININLLHVLHTLFDKKSINETAAHLNISQSSVSYSLKQLREIFHDDLLITTNKRNVKMTQLANSLSKPLEETISKMKKVLNFKEFAPLTSNRKFKIAITDYSVLLLLSKLYNYLAKYAPGIIIETVPFEHKTIYEQLEIGEFDLATGSFSTIQKSDRVNYKYLFSDYISGAVSTGHPVLSAGKILTFKNYIKYPHLFITTPARKEFKDLREKVSKIKENYNGNLFIHNSFMSFHSIENTSMILLAPERVIHIAQRNHSIELIKPDFINVDFTTSVCYTKQSTEDKALMWLVDVFNEISEEYRAIVDE